MQSVVVRSGVLASAVFVGILCAAFPAARAMLRADGPTSTALGNIGVASRWLFDGTLNSARSSGFLVDVGEKRLFGIDDLGIVQVRCAGRSGAFGAIVSLARLSSPVGNETAVRGEPFFWGSDHFGVSFGIDATVLSLTETEPLRHIAARSSASAAVIRNVVVGYTIENVRLAGANIPGVAARAHLAVHTDSRITGVAGVRFDREGATGVNVGTRVPLGSVITIAMGYESKSQNITSTLAIHIHSVALTAFAAFHPVLGASQAVFLSWAR